MGIVNALEIAFTLNAKFLAKGETVSGKQRVSFDEGGISWNGNVYRELTFTPLEDDASFSLEDVTIGINFHWERQETQTFLGTLRLVVDEGKITDHQPGAGRRLSDQRHLVRDERHFFPGVSESPCRHLPKLAFSTD